MNELSRTMAVSVCLSTHAYLQIWRFLMTVDRSLFCLYTKIWLENEEINTIFLFISGKHSERNSTHALKPSSNPKIPSKLASNRRPIDKVSKYLLK